MSRQKSNSTLSERHLTDVHCHILPGIDDGSKSVEESILLLQALGSQGITTVVATPHFYPSHEEPQSFLDRRSAAAERLMSECPPELPEIYLGAEVLYYKGISRMAELEQLCTQGTKMLLLEMPDGEWSEYTQREVAEMAGNPQLSLLLAHIERYMPFQHSEVFDWLLDSGVKMQVNADFFLNFRSRHRALKMLGMGRIQFIGSDCHDIAERPPRIGEALSTVERRFGSKVIDMLEQNCAEYFFSS